MTERERLLDELRPVAFAIAYRMLGSVSEAEDVVQEALLRLHQTLDAGEQIVSPRAFVATVTTRLAINELRSAPARRERYVGEWLPEPLITDGLEDPARHAETADSLSLAMLVLLESLSPSSVRCCCSTMCSGGKVPALARPLRRAQPCRARTDQLCRRTPCRGVVARSRGQRRPGSALSRCPAAAELACSCRVGPCDSAHSPPLMPSLPFSLHDSARAHQSRRPSGVSPARGAVGVGLPLAGRPLQTLI